MSFTPSEVILGATVPLENGSTITFSIAGHVEAERDIDDAVVIFGRKLLKYTNCATDADRLTVRQIISSITSTPLDEVPDVGTPTPPAATVTQCIKPPVDAEDIARQQHADKLKADLERLQADHDARVARRAATAPDPAPVNKYDNRMPDRSPDDDLPYQQTEIPAQAASQPKPNPTPSPKPADGDGDETCEKCGCAIPKAQAKLSQLFQSKTLCKKCMEAP